MKRGDVVIVDFSVYNPAEKVRPALVLQNDRDNARMQNTIVALITGNLRRAGEPTQFLLDAKHPDFLASGLHKDSVLNCSNLITIRRQDILRTIGTLSRDTMKQIDAFLGAKRPAGSHALDAGCGLRRASRRQLNGRRPRNVSGRGVDDRGKSRP
jgi:mRNA interferase MazF